MHQLIPTDLPRMNRTHLRRYLAPAILVILVLPFVAFAIPQLVGASASYVVVSNSMTPQFHSGDVVIVYDVPPSQIEVGDVITYRPPTGGPITTHQVVGIDTQDGQRVFQTKGTANEEPDPYRVAPGAIIGVVGFHIPYLGVLIGWLGTDYGIVLFIVVPSFLLIVTELWDLKREISTDSGDASAPEPADLAPERPDRKEANGGQPSTPSVMEDEP